MVLRETGCKGLRWIELAQDRVQWQGLVNMVMHCKQLNDSASLSSYFICFVRRYVSRYSSVV
jgi:hypothetical protein